MTEPALMTEPARSASLKSLVFAGILLLSLCVRLALLGAAPLGDAEAREALNAASGTTESSPFWYEAERAPSASGAYQAGTWLLFQAVGSSDATARLLPALLGSLVVLSPWLLRRRLGTAPALAASCLLAVSPILVASSRHASGAGIATTALALAASLGILALDGDLSRERAVVAIGAAVALGLAAGPLFFAGLLGLLVASILASTVVTSAWPPGAAREAGRRILPGALQIGLVGAAVISTGAGLLPRGWTALGEGLRQWLTGWIGVGSMHALTPPGILAAYEPLVLVFGVVGTVAAWRTRDVLGVGLSLWAGVGLLLAVAYPGRDGASLAWSVVPLAVLAGRAVVGEAETILGQRSPWTGVGVAALLVVLAFYAGIQLSAYAGGIGPGVNPLNVGLRLWIALGALLVCGLTVVLIGFGWSWQVARSGAFLAASVTLIFMTVSTGTSLNGQPERLGADELWSPTAPTYGIHRLASTLASLSSSETGVRGELPLAILAVEPPPSLLWASRGLPRFETTDSGSPESPPLLLLPLDAPIPESSESYLGQTIPISERWDFFGPFPSDPIQWWFRRSLPTIETIWVLLVRADVATLGESETPVGEGP